LNRKASRNSFTSRFLSSVSFSTFLNRLTGITYYLNNTHQSNGDKSINYNNLGNITGKTGIAAEDSIRYGEDNYGPHALTSISNPSSAHTRRPVEIISFYYLA